MYEICRCGNVMFHCHFCYIFWNECLRCNLGCKSWGEFWPSRHLLLTLLTHHCYFVMWTWLWLCCAWQIFHCWFRIGSSRNYIP